MIKVTVYACDNLYKGFKVEGHAGFDEYGKDIVCASVSVLVINCVNSIDTFTEDAYRVNQDEEKGLIELEFQGCASYESQILIDSMILGLRKIRTENNKYITLDFKEV